MAAVDPYRRAAFARIVLLLPVCLAAWYLASPPLRQLQVDPQVAPLLGWAPGVREMVAFGYQVGSLLLPTLAPVALWLAFARGLWMPAARPTAS